MREELLVPVAILTLGIVVPSGWLILAGMFYYCAMLLRRKKHD